MKPVLWMAVVGLALAGCTTTPRQAFVTPLPDPHEQSNRAVADAQFALNRAVVRPVNQVYQAAVPEVIRDRITSARNNLDEPRIFINNVLQGRAEAANATLGRFLVNSTLGVGGLFDVAAQGGLARQTGDFGQTLYVWGAPAGDFLVLPLLGPTTQRDAIGRVVDIAGDPIGWMFFGTLGTPTADYVNGGLAALEVLERARMLDDVERDSVDYYARLKSLWEQNRAAELRSADTPVAVPYARPR